MVTHFKESQLKKNYIQGAQMADHCRMLCFPGDFPDPTRL